MQKSKMAEAAILKSVFSGNSAICERIRTKFDTDRNSGTGSGFTRKIDIPEHHRWWQYHTEIQIVSHNWVITAYCTVCS